MKEKELVLEQPYDYSADFLKKAQLDITQIANNNIIETETDLTVIKFPQQTTIKFT